METPTQKLHRLTSYSPERDWDAPFDDPQAWQAPETNDIETLPWFYKRYDESLPRIELPRDLPTTTASAVSVIAGTANVEARELDLPHLSRMLHHSAGVARTAERPYGTFLFRAAGSAGGRFPMELYVAVPEGTPSLPGGVHWYHPQDHALVTIGPPPVGGAPTLIVTGIPWRTGWRYRERGHRHIYWDSGTMLAQFLAAGDSAGIATQLYSWFPDAAVNELVGADGIHEWPVAVVALGEGGPAIEVTGDAAKGEVDAAPLEFPLVTAAQHAGNRNALGSPWDRGTQVEVETESTGSIETVLLARGSQRRMDASRGLPEKLLRSSMQAALRGIDEPHFIVVHDVDGIEPGIYRWPELSAPVRAGSMRDELYRVCLKQGLGSDAAFVVIGATDVGALDDRQYREAQLAAGLVEGRLHILAYAQGAGASGMTFLDSEIPALIGEPLDGLLFTCVGVPEYRNAPGGSPGAPKAVRTVIPRFED